VLLLDEPFGALDARVRQELRQWLRRLHDDVGVTSVFVTHDQEEAFSVADRVVVMRGGRVEQTGTPQQVFEHPANAFVMDFLGNVNVFPGRVQNGRAVAGGLEVSCPEHDHDDPRPASVYVRPHELDIDRSPDGASSLPARVVHVNPAGPVTRVELLALDSGSVVHVEVSPGRYAELGLKPGDTVYVSPRRARVFVPEYSI
jgi:sulfate transport system ATP-binding protein